MGVGQNVVDLVRKDELLGRARVVITREIIIGRGVSSPTSRRRLGEGQRSQGTPPLPNFAGNHPARGETREGEGDGTTAPRVAAEIAFRGY